MNPFLLRSTAFCSLLIIFAFGSLFGQTRTTPKGDDRAYQVVINHEEQYSIVLLNQRTPKGWKAVGEKGSLKDCQAYIKEVWTDMRPLSVRQMNLGRTTIYQVVINHEEQYSIWPKAKKIPQNWKAVGESGSLRQCMDYIEEVWTDMRPLSLRKRIGQ